MTTLNLLQPSRINTGLSSYELLNRVFDYKKTHLALLGRKMMFHELPKKRGVWDPHGVDGWYFGRSLNHYLCHRFYFNKTRAERIMQTIKFFLHKGRILKKYAKRVAPNAALRLIQALCNPSPGALFSASNKDTSDELYKLASIYAN